MTEEEIKQQIAVLLERANELTDPLDAYLFEEMENE